MTHILHHEVEGSRYSSHLLWGRMLDWSAEEIYEGK